MTQSQTKKVKLHYFCIAAVLFGLFVYACLPTGIVPLDDDFGYLRSVVSTIQHGRPWTDDWLEPWTASFSSISAAIYWVTGNFYGATYGLLAFLSAISFVICSLLLRMRGTGLPQALFFAAILLTFPTVFWKTIQYTSMALYIPCLLGAIWSCLNRRWWIFFVIWSLAIAARQSAIAWIMIPLTVAVQNFWREKRSLHTPDFWQPIFVAILGGLMFLMLNVWMNKTHAQTVVTDHLFECGSMKGMLSVSVIGLGVYLVAMGLGFLIERLNCLVLIGGHKTRPPAQFTGIAIVVVALCSVDLRSLVNWEHLTMSGATGYWYLKFLVLASGVGWIFRRGIIYAEFAVCAIAVLLAVSLRAAVWDYYFLDLAVLGFFGGSLQFEVTVKPSASPQWMRWAARLGLVSVVIANGLLVLDFKAWVDRGTALCFVSEKALREGRLKPEELSFAPFGFAAWHLYPYYIENEGRTSSQIDGFNAFYLRPDVMQVGQGYSHILHILPRFRHVPPADRHNLIAEWHTRFLWFFDAEYFILRFKTETESAAKVSLQSSYHLEPFPLNEAEWKQLILRAYP